MSQLLPPAPEKNNKSPQFNQSSIMNMTATSGGLPFHYHTLSRQKAAGSHYHSVFAKKMSSTGGLASDSPNKTTTFPLTKIPNNESINDIREHSVFSRNEVKRTLKYKLNSNQTQIQKRKDQTSLGMTSASYQEKDNINIIEQTIRMKLLKAGGFQGLSKKMAFLSTTSLTAEELEAEEKKNEMMFEELNESLIGIFKELPETVKVLKKKELGLKKEALKKEKRSLKDHQSSSQTLSGSFATLQKYFNKKVQNHSPTAAGRGLPTLQSINPLRKTINDRQNDIEASNHKSAHRRSPNPAILIQTNLPMDNNNNISSVSPFKKYAGDSFFKSIPLASESPMNHLKMPSPLKKLKIFPEQQQQQSALKLGNQSKNNQVSCSSSTVTTSELQQQYNSRNEHKHHLMLKTFNNFYNQPKKQQHSPLQNNKSNHLSPINNLLHPDHHQRYSKNNLINQSNHKRLTKKHQLLQQSSSKEQNNLSPEMLPEVKEARTRQYQDLLQKFLKDRGRGLSLQGAGGGDGLPTIELRMPGTSLGFQQQTECDDIHTLMHSALDTPQHANQRIEQLINEGIGFANLIEDSPEDQRVNRESGISSQLQSQSTMKKKGTIQGRGAQAFEFMQEKMLVQSAKQIQRFIGAYKNIDRIAEIDESSIDNNIEDIISPRKQTQALINQHPTISQLKLAKDPIIQYLKHAKKNNMPPLKIAFKRMRHMDKMEEEDEEELELAYNLRGIQINKQFAQAFSQNLRFNPHVSYLILSSNHLNDESFAHIVPNLPKLIKKLDISKNPDLTIKSYQLLSQKLISMKAEMTHLVFEGNQMGDDSCRVICELVVHLGSVVVLNLSKCQITCIGAEYIGILLMTKNLHIKALLIHWNKILGRGSIALAKALMKNHSLQIFDASFNSFGSSAVKNVSRASNQMTNSSNSQQQQAVQLSVRTKFSSSYQTTTQQQPAVTNKRESSNAFEIKDIEGSTQSSQKWAEAFIENKTLIHLDFSFNNFRLPDIQVIGDALRFNHTLLGIHLMGNEAKVDELGFVIPDKGAMDPASYQVFTRIPQILKTGKIHSAEKMHLNVSSNCWICEGWTHLQFVIHSEKVEALIANDDYRERFMTKFGVACTIVVNLHMNFDGYQAHKMALNYSGYRGYFTLYRMVPPGKLNYFYTVGYSSDIDKNHPQELKHLVDEGHPTTVYPKGRIRIEEGTIQVPKLNFIEGDIRQLCQILTLIDIKKIKALPRPEEGVEVRPKTPWTFEKAFFSKNRPFFEGTIESCFEFDWNCTKIEKWLANCLKPQRDALYDYLKANYFYILEAYRYLSALNPSGKYFSIGTNVFSDTVQNCKGIIDYNTLKQSDVDLEFISTKASGMNIKWDTNPERQLIRYQFFEIFVRLGISKYFKTKYCKTIDKAIHKLFHDHVLPYFCTFNAHKFREEKMYTEELDNSVQKNMQTLKDIYSKYTGREGLGGETKYMSMTEFFDLISLSQVIDENFGSREINIIYNASMHIQIDEIRADRHCKMQFVEFVEAICRVADRVVVNKVGLDNVSSEEEDEEDEDEDEYTDDSEDDLHHVPSERDARKPPHIPAGKQIHTDPHPIKSGVIGAKFHADEDYNFGENILEKVSRQAKRRRSAIGEGDEEFEDLDDEEGGKKKKRRKRKHKKESKGDASIQIEVQPAGADKLIVPAALKQSQVDSQKADQMIPDLIKKDIPLGYKLNEYIRKVALMSMGQDYAYLFIRKNNLQSLAFLYYSSWTSNDAWVFKQLAAQQKREKAEAARQAAALLGND